jgi:hypothetical protein
VGSSQRLECPTAAGEATYDADCTINSMLTDAAGTRLSCCSSVSWPLSSGVRSNSPGANKRSGVCIHLLLTFVDDPCGGLQSLCKTCDASAYVSCILLASAAGSSEVGSYWTHLAGRAVLVSAKKNHFVRKHFLVATGCSGRLLSCDICCLISLIHHCTSITLSYIALILDLRTTRSAQHICAACMSQSPANCPP